MRGGGLESTLFLSMLILRRQGPLIVCKMVAPFANSAIKSGSSPLVKLHLLHSGKSGIPSNNNEARISLLLVEANNFTILYSIGIAVWNF